MNFTDIIALALRNLRQSKLRTALTVIGVIVGVAAIITMVSFGIGLQRNIIGQAFARLDAFTAITVLGADADDLLALSEGRLPDEEDDTDAAQPAASPAASPAATPTTTAPAAVASVTPTATPQRPQRVLDDAMVAEIAALNGVRFAAPIVSFNGFVRFNGRTRSQNIAGVASGDDPRLRNIRAGHGLVNEAANEIVINESVLTAFSPEAFRRRRNRRGGGPGGGGGPFQTAEVKSDAELVAAAQAVLGQEVILLSLPLTESAAADANQVGDASDSIFGIPLMALPSAATNAPTPDATGNASAQQVDARYEKHAYRIVGVLKNEGGINLNPLGNASFFIPLPQAKRLRLANLAPWERMGDALMGHSGYRAVEVRVTDPSQIKPVTAKLESYGLRAFSVTNQLEEIERIFLIINSSLALLGGIALLVASFGISNTMIMSIRERTREIGIMKAIGGSDGEIMRIFFVEASLIGLLGGTLGVLAGWGVGRIANTLANYWIVRQAGVAMRYIEFFSIPWYLALSAILFALLISLLAAIYPASRAAKVDPIKALRYE